MNIKVAAFTVSEKSGNMERRSNAIDGAATHKKGVAIKKQTRNNQFSKA